MECALWYMSHGSARYEIYDNEEDAARNAIWMADDGDYGFPSGVQYPDGSYTSLEEWQLYKAESDRVWQDVIRQARVDAAKPKPATRKIRPPFDHSDTVTVLADAPAWLGRPVRPPVGE